MRKNEVKAKMARGECTTNGWCALGSPYSAELMGHAGFDSVTVDLQHGMFDFTQALLMLQALSSTPAVPIVRAPWNDTAVIMHLLDAGAYGVICPMINNRQEAERLVAACRYAPVGMRSYGPARGLLYGGPDYFDHANSEIVVFAMIETQDGINNLDDILATPGLDGVYIGPNDLALILGTRPGTDLTDQRCIDTIAHILARGRAFNKFVGIFCANGTVGAIRRKQGFDLVTLTHEGNYLTQAAKAAIAASRVEPAEGAVPTPSTGY
ncbi:MAG TPA: aldolase/citrate lyase family protein [Zoogloea sp.]|nr:aldolase/citrate lyase family protein [Zoogloea sp.]